MYSDIISVLYHILRTVLFLLIVTINLPHSRYKTVFAYMYIFSEARAEENTTNLIITSIY